MKFVITSPTRAIIQGASDEELSEVTKALSYKNTANEHQYRRHLNNIWLRRKDEAQWKVTGEGIKKSIKQTVAWFDGQHYIRPGSIPYLLNEFPNVKVENKIKYPEPHKIPWVKQLPFTLHSYQEESVVKLIAEKHGNVELTTGCHAKGTKILMFDGSIKNVEDVVIGDVLIGPDSSPREVLRLCRGAEELYKITPTKGESFVVNKSHVLSLQRTNMGKCYIRKDGTSASQENGPNPISNVVVETYLQLPKTQKHLLKLYRVPVEFKKPQLLKIPPYILGIWLGDGASSRASLTTMDEEIRTEWCNYLISLNLKISVGIKTNNRARSYSGILENYISMGNLPKNSVRRQNEFNARLNDYNLINNKHVPIEYLTSSKKDRLELLAGLIDTDGYLGTGYYEISQKSTELANNIVFLARSLGFGVTIKKQEKGCQNGFVGEYNIVNILGNIEQIPCKLPRKIPKPRQQIKNTSRTGFTIESVGIGDYYGFELDSDSLYLTADFTVHHNSGKSAIILKICRETGFKTVVMAPSRSIFHELLEKFEFHLGKNNVGAFGDGKKKLGKRITIAISDSIVNIKPATEEWRFFSGLEMLIADESHGLAAETLDKSCNGVFSEIPYRFFLSATQTRGDGAEKLLQSIIGKTVHTLTTAEAVEKGYICSHEFRIVELESSNPNFASADALEMKRKHLLQNRNICAFIAKLAIADAKLYGRQSLILVEELSQIAALFPLFKEVGIATVIAHSETKKDRLEELGLEKVDPSESIEAFNKGEALIVIGTSCIATGTNIFPVHNCFNWFGGASEIKTKQGAVGRAVRHGHQNPWAHKCVEKTKALIWDFNVHDIDLMVDHLQKRIGYYKESGTLIKLVKIS